jgi:hypothetical protein
VTELRDLLAQFLAEVRAGKMDPKLGNSISYMGINLLRTMDAAETRHKQQPLAGGTVREIYKAKWLREKESQLAQELEQEYAGPVDP